MVDREAAIDGSQLSALPLLGTLSLRRDRGALLAAARLCGRLSAVNPRCVSSVAALRLDELAAAQFRADLLLLAGETQRRCPYHVEFPAAACRQLADDAALGSARWSCCGLAPQLLHNNTNTHDRGGDSSVPRFVSADRALLREFVAAWAGAQRWRLSNVVNDAERIGNDDGCTITEAPSGWSVSLANALPAAISAAFRSLGVDAPRPRCSALVLTRFVEQVGVRFNARLQRRLSLAAMCARSERLGDAMTCCGERALDEFVARALQPLCPAFATISERGGVRLTWRAVAYDNDVIDVASAVALRVASVESDVGEREVFDLTVPRTHSFAANGAVVHNCNSFLPVFLLLYVVQYLLLLVLYRDSFVSMIASNALYAVAFALYYRLTFLGYSTLPFLQHTTLFLYPIALVGAASVVMCLFGANSTVLVLNWYMRSSV